MSDIGGSLRRFCTKTLRFCLYGWFTRYSWGAGSVLLNAVCFFIVALVVYQRDEEKERVCLALNVWHEARGEPLAGQLAVAGNTLNRVRLPSYPKTVCGVVYQRNTRGCQYSWTCDGKPDASYAQVRGSRSDLVARAVYAGLWGDVSDGSTHYFAAYLHGQGKAPTWHKEMKLVVRIGGHEFYRDPKATSPKK